MSSIIKNGKEYDVDTSTVTGKQFIYEEAFIDAYKDSDDPFMQYMINGMVEGFLDHIITTMSKFVNDLWNLLNDKDLDDIHYYYTLYDSVCNNYFELDSIYSSYKNGSSNIYWDLLDHDIEYWWGIESEGCDLPDLKTVLSEPFNTNMRKLIKEAKNNVRK